MTTPKIQSIRRRAQHGRVFPEPELTRYVELLEALNGLSDQKRELSALKRRVKSDIKGIAAEANRLRVTLTKEMKGLGEREREVLLKSIRLSPAHIWGKIKRG